MWFRFLKRASSLHWEILLCYKKHLSWAKGGQRTAVTPDWNAEGISSAGCYSKSWESSETDHKLFWWVTTQLKQTECVWVLSFMNQKSMFKGIFSPLSEELKVRSEDPPWNLASKFFCTGTHSCFSHRLTVRASAGMK